MNEVEQKILLDIEINKRCMKEDISDTHKRLLELWIKYDEELLAIIKKNRIKEKK
jgi:hypothetical protein